MPVLVAVAVAVSVRPVARDGGGRVEQQVLQHVHRALLRFAIARQRVEFGLEQQLVTVEQVLIGDAGGLVPARAH